MSVQGEITIKMPENRHMILNLSSSLVSGQGGQSQSENDR